MMQSSTTPSTACSGRQLGTLSYFHFNPDVHTVEKPYEIVVDTSNKSPLLKNLKRTNQEFEDRQVIVEDIRGREGDITLEKNGACWKVWDGPPEWHNISLEKIKDKGHQWVNDTYIGEVEKFIKEEVEKMDAESTVQGGRVDFVKVFDYKLRTSVGIDGFKSRTLNLRDGLDPMIPATHPHVDQSFEGAKTRLKEHMKKDADVLLKRRFRIVK
ncbi:hypothetical protein VTL71DRAFT_10332 [Oculimacula yallundae]|uniref:Uncharacterized protein n=1 Tax=Oculimacula yallundae TaxID=86028 RepID=A0ABR4CSP0_9HELO